VAPVGPRKRAERRGKLVSPERRRRCVDHVRQAHRVSERRVCRVLGQSRTSQRYQAITAPDEEPLTAAIVRLASQYGRYGYRRITAMLRDEGWHVNHKRVERIWRREGLKVPQNNPSGAGSGSTTDPASGSGRAGATMSGPTTSSRPAPMRERRSAC